MDQEGRREAYPIPKSDDTGPIFEYPISPVRGTSEHDCGSYSSAWAERAPMDRNQLITFSCRVPRPVAASKAVPSA